MFELSEKSKANRAGVDSRLIEISDSAIKLTFVDFGHGPYSGLRTVEDQQELHRIGKSPHCDGVNQRSLHQDGKALDFYAYVHGHASWHHPHLMAVACAFYQAAAILRYRIRWGGTWKASNPTIIDGVTFGWDCPHIELLD